MLLRGLDYEHLDRTVIIGGRRRNWGKEFRH